MHIKEMVGDFDYMVYRDNAFTLEQDDLGELDENSFAFKRIGVDYYRVFDFSNGIPEGMEFLKKIEPKYDTRRDFGKLVDKVENWGGKIFWKPDVCDGFDLISKVLIFKDRDRIRFTVDKSSPYIFDALILNKTDPFETIDFIENKVNIVFTNKTIHILKFEEPEKTKIKIID